MLNHQNISEKTYEILSHQIINQKLKPGERLVEEQLARNLGISRTPLREAINRLAKEGFVTLEPRKGASVKQFQVKDIIEVYDIRMALEGLAVQLAIAKLSKSELEKLKKQFSSKNIKVLLKADTELHSIIIRNCGNEKLKDILNNLHSLIHTFRVVGYGSKKRLAGATTDHISIIDALEKGQGELAEKLVKKHIAKTKLEIIQEFEKQKNIHIVYENSWQGQL